MSHDQSIQFTLSSFKVICFVFLILLSSIQAYKEIKAYRLIQYEKEGKVFGSQYASLSYIGAHYKSNTLRKISLIKLMDLTEINELKDFLSSQATAFLLILPKKEDLSKEVKNLFSFAQTLFSEGSFLSPIYFIVEDNDINNIYNELKDQIKSEDSIQKAAIFGLFEMGDSLFQFNLSSNEPKKIESLQLENIYGFLESSKRIDENGTGHTQNPIILLASSYDDLSVIPDFSNGINDRVTGVIGLLEISRILSKYYENYSDSIQYDILVLLSSASQVDHQGVFSFMDSLNTSIIDNIQYAFYIDNLSGNINSFSLYQTDQPQTNSELENPFVSHLKSAFPLLKTIQIPVNEDKKFGHSYFLKKNVPSATFSSSSKENIILNSFERNEIFNDFSKKELIENIRSLSKALISLILNINDENIFANKEENGFIDEDHINSLIMFFNQNSRFLLNLQKGSLVNKEIFSLLSEYTQRTSKQAFEVKSIQLFDSNSGMLKVYSVKSKMIDLYILVGVFIYLFAVYLIFKGVGNFIKSIKETFSE